MNILQTETMENIKAVTAFPPLTSGKTKKFIEQYHTIISNAISDLVLNDNLSHNVSEIHSILKDSAVQAHNTLNKNKNFYFFKSKPWWSTNLTRKKISLQHFFNIWKSDGFKKGTTSHSRYCYARKVFVKRLRRIKTKLQLITV